MSWHFGSVPKPSMTNPFLNYNPNDDFKGWIHCLMLRMIVIKRKLPGNWEQTNQTGFLLLQDVDIVWDVHYHFKRTMVSSSELTKSIIPVKDLTEKDNSFTLVHSGRVALMALNLLYAPDESACGGLGGLLPQPGQELEHSFLFSWCLLHTLVCMWRSVLPFSWSPAHVRVEMESVGWRRWVQSLPCICWLQKVLLIIYRRWEAWHKLLFSSLGGLFTLDVYF